MNILFIHQYFRTPEEGGGIRSYLMGKALVEAGHTVNMITAHNEGSYLYKEIDGIKVHYLPIYYENKLGFAGRSYAFLKFMFQSTFKALKLPKADLCYASSSPLTVGIIAIILKRVRGVPYIFEVMDLWPEAPIQMGFVGNGFLKRFLYWLEKISYKNAKALVAASPGMQEGVLKVCPSASTLMIPNMSDCDFFLPQPKDPSLILKYAVKDKFVCCYTGAIGLANDLNVLIQLASKIKESGYDRIHFLIAGEGAYLSIIKDKAEELKLGNISFLGHVSKNEIAEIYNVSDVNLILFSKEPILSTNSPNKFFDSIAAGLPTITNKKGWVQELCEENSCGKYFDSDQPEEFIKIIKQFDEHKNILSKYGNNARQLAEKTFNKDILLKKFLRLFVCD